MKTKNALIPIVNANDSTAVIDESICALGSALVEQDDVSRKQAVKNRKIDHLIYMDTAKANMHWNQFTKSMIYHILSYMILGPLTPLVIQCFETWTFMTNISLLPSKLSTL